MKKFLLLSLILFAVLGLLEILERYNVVKETKNPIKGIKGKKSSSNYNPFLQVSSTTNVNDLHPDEYRKVFYAQKISHQLFGSFPRTPPASHYKDNYKGQSPLY
jgi:hypothetical protein